MDFSKAENKVARALFEIALQRELAKGMNEFDEILQKWKTERPQDNRESYYAIFTSVKDFDKHIARRYDGLKNSMFYNTIIGLLVDEVINAQDLIGFAQERQNELLSISKQHKDFR
ncbi:hypothetical protein EZ449_18410 [Pedobacter frigidisoli]|uniref:Uncharacterized protein n=1 Tax=Pedobacter frigidisoli TaxID=2530455 RepID=A0A4R0NN61_9SPHI|nr:hypothetical protein [Pedobacter frigidisoli]TCD02332.1 hypothetical protein EZ449_18410 [Pedobacter frigidisoli]